MNGEQRHILGFQIQQAIMRARPDWTTYIGHRPGEHLPFLCGQLARIAEEEIRRDNMAEEIARK